MLRRPNRTNLVRMHSNTQLVHDWAMLDTCYPTHQAFEIVTTLAEDPFSGRKESDVIKRTVINFGGFCRVDMGWMISREPTPPHPAAWITLDPSLIERWAENWNLSPTLLHSNGFGNNYMGWCGLHHLMSHTANGLTWQLANMLRWPAWSEHLSAISRKWEFEGGVPIRFGNPHYSLVDAFDSV